MKRILSILFYLLIVNWVSADNLTMKKIWLEHDVTRSGEKGMVVHIAFDISNMKGQKCKAIAYFEYPKGTGLKDRNGRYKTTNGNVCSSASFTPGYINTTYSDLDIFIPVSELHLLSGKRTYYTQVYIQAPSGKFIGHSQYASFVGTGNEANGNQHNNKVQSNRSNGIVKTWREDLGYNMFAINRVNAAGIRMRTIYRPCNACKGTTRCNACYGTAVCAICKGQGGIVTSGYGRYIPCALCGQTGKCNLCKGTGKCVCTNYDYPGYVPGSTLTTDANGRTIYYDGKSSSENSSSSSSSSRSTRSSCSKCGGRRYESTPYEYAAGSTAGWRQPYHNTSGSSCPYCNYKTSHYHYPCPECHGTGHN